MGRPIQLSDTNSPNSKQLASDLTTFLAALHQIPVSTLTDLETRPTLTSRPELSEVRSATTPVLKTRLATQEFDRLERWWHQLLTDSWMQEYPVSVIHQDFWHENLLADPESDRLAGVLDCEHSRISYPAVDLVPVDYLGQGFATDVFSVYKKTVESIETRFADRLDQHRVLREFGGIR